MGGWLKAIVLVLLLIFVGIPALNYVTAHPDIIPHGNVVSHGQQ